MTLLANIKIEKCSWRVLRSKVVVGKEGIINGNIKSNEIEVSGSINGSVDVTEFLYLTATARINGDVQYKKIQIDPEGVINGKMAIKGATVKIQDGKQNKKIEAKAS